MYHAYLRLGNKRILRLPFVRRHHHLHRGKLVFWVHVFSREYRFVYHGRFYAKEW